MKTPEAFPLAHRKVIADLLKDEYQGLRRKACDRRSRKAEELRYALIKEFAEKNGANRLVGEIEVAEKKVSTLKSDLSKLGFELGCYGDLAVKDSRRNPIAGQIEKRIVADLGTAGSIDDRFDKALIGIMTAASVEDAEKILKSVSEL